MSILYGTKENKKCFHWTFYSMFLHLQTLKTINLCSQAGLSFTCPPQTPGNLTDVNNPFKVILCFLKQEASFVPAQSMSNDLIGLLKPERAGQVGIKVCSFHFDFIGRRKPVWKPIRNHRQLSSLSRYFFSAEFCELLYQITRNTQWLVKY